MKKFLISFLASIFLFGTILPSISMAQETIIVIKNNNLKVEEVINSDSFDLSKEMLNNVDIDTGELYSGAEIQPMFFLGPLFRVVLTAGNYISKMNRVGKVVKSTRTIVATEAHIFSKNHLDLGIMKLGINRQAIVDSGIDVISKVDDLDFLKKGHNQIWTTINGNPAEIRVFVDDAGELLSFDMFYRTVSVIKPGANLVLH